MNIKTRITSIVFIIAATIMNITAEEGGYLTTSNGYWRMAIVEVNNRDFYYSCTDNALLHFSTDTWLINANEWNKGRSAGNVAEEVAETLSSLDDTAWDVYYRYAITSIHDDIMIKESPNIIVKIWHYKKTRYITVTIFQDGNTYTFCYNHAGCNTIDADTIASCLGK